MSFFDLFKNPLQRATERELDDYNINQSMNDFDAVAPSAESISDYLPGIEAQQRSDLLKALGDYSMPSFAPSAGMLAADKGMNQVGNMLDVVSRFQPMPGQQYINPDVMNVANRLGDVQNRLRTSTTRYGAGMDDMRRGLMANQYNTMAGRNIQNMMNALQSTTSQRRSQAKITDKTQQGAIDRMNKEMKTKLNELKKKAQRARQEGDENALADALLEIGRLVGSVAL